MSALLPKQSIDRRLIKAATRIGHTADDLSEAVNGILSPAQALARTKELLANATVHDEYAERRLLLLRMSQWLEDIQRDHGTNIKAIPGINRAFKLISDQLERSSLNADEVTTKLAETHAEYFVTAYLKGFERAIDLFQKESGEILDAEVVEEIATESIGEAKKYVDTVTVQEIED